MLALKSFIHQSIKSLDNDELAMLSDTLRLDVRNYDNRSDLHRALAALLSLDKDTSLGIFVSWLQTAQQDKRQEKDSNPFANTFVPKISPLGHDLEKIKSMAQRHPHVPNQHDGEMILTPKTPHEPAIHQIKEHHLEEELAKRLDEIRELEVLFKEAERGVHKGTPSFEKLKKFLVQLTLLRAKEDEARQFFIQRNQLLAERNAKLQDENFRTHEQLEFFVEGFAHLRKRHDAIIEQAAQTQAMNQTLENMLLGMQANDALHASHLQSLLAKQVEATEWFRTHLNDARDQINTLQKQVDEARQRMHQAQHHRDDFRKDATCLRFQMRKMKRKMQRLEQNELKMQLFQFQLRQVRTSLSNLLMLLGDTIARDAKAAKPSGLSREFVKMVKTLSVTTITAPSSSSSSSPSPATAVNTTNRLDDLALGLSSAPVVEELAVVQRPRNLQVEDLFRALVLLGGKDHEEPEACALLLSEKLHFVSFDVLSFVHHTMESLTPPPAQIATASASSGDSEAIETDAVALASTPTVLPLDICMYLPSMVDQVRGLLKTEDAHGFILYNWEFSRKEIDTLTSLGMTIDAILELHCPPAPVVPTPSASKAVASSAAKKTSASSSSSSPSKAAPKPGARGAKAAASPPSKTTPASKSPPRSNATAAASKKAGASSTTSKTRGATPTANKSDKKSGTPAAKARLVPTIDRAKVFSGMHHVFRSVGFALGPEERVDRIFDILEQQKNARMVPTIAWKDETLASEHERFCMCAEELEMRMALEEEKRKPKKSVAAASSSSSASGGAASSTSPSTTTTGASSKTGASPVAKKKVGSPTQARAGATRVTSSSRTSSRSGSPSKKSPSRQGSPTSRGSSKTSSSSSGSRNSTGSKSRGASPGKGAPKSPAKPSGSPSSRGGVSTSPANSGARRSQAESPPKRSANTSPTTKR